jgi:hypothetical protein
MCCLELDFSYSQMHLQARQSLLGSVFSGDQWTQFSHYASVRVGAGVIVPSHISEWTRRLVSDPIGGTATCSFSSVMMKPAQKPGDEDLGILACSLTDKIR